MGTNAQANWDDLRYVLAVADAGSVAGAGRLLGVNHATVLRRIAAFETRYGFRVFEKTAHGYRLAPDKRALVEAMREAGEAVGQVERLIEAERPRVSSSIRITSTDAFCYVLLPRIIAGLAQEVSSPISILSSTTHVDFTRLHADITVRPAVELPEELSGSKAAEFRFGVYSSDTGDNAWLGFDGVIARTAAADWLREKTKRQNIAMSCDSFVMLAGLAAEGKGRVVLPAFLGDAWPGLKCHELLDIPPVPVWVASHVDLAHSGRLRRARRYLSAALAADGPRLMGARS